MAGVRQLSGSELFKGGGFYTGNSANQIISNIGLLYNHN